MRIFILSLGFIGIWVGIFQDKRKLFESVKNFTPLPDTFNYWLFKLLFILGGLFLLLLEFMVCLIFRKYIPLIELKGAIVQEQGLQRRSLCFFSLRAEQLKKE
jgi:hypothetical protein